MLRLITVAVFIGLLGGCALFPDPDEATKGWSVEKLYNEAKTARDAGDYEQAIKYYEILEARYPLGRFAQQAQMDMIYAYYKADEPESAIAAADRFIKLYPRHPQVDYVYYMKGVVYFNESGGILAEYFPIDMSDRDQGAAKKSFKAFEDLVKLYPASQYSEDAAQRMVYLRNSLARYEIHVADYYMRRGAYLAAARRAAYVVEHYDRTPAMSQALVIMVRAYKKMGMEELAADALRVLKLNYPDHPDLPALENLRAG